MTVILRFYARYDLDLIALLHNHYDVGKMTKEALKAYAKGEPLCFDVPVCRVVQVPKKPIRIVITISDKDAVELLKQVRPRYRNAFCKMLLREALSTRSLDSFLMSDKCRKMERKRVDNQPLAENMTPAPRREFKMMEEQDETVEKKEFVREKPVRRKTGKTSEGKTASEKPFTDKQLTERPVQEHTETAEHVRGEAARKARSPFPSPAYETARQTGNTERPAAQTGSSSYERPFNRNVTPPPAKTQEETPSEASYSADETSRMDAMFASLAGF